jgi:hypothetical protein
MSIQTNQEAVMGQAIPRQHPAVVLRSHFNFVRNLLAVAMVAVVGLTIAVVIVANDGDEVASTSSAQSAPATAQPALPDGLRYDGGPEEGTRGAQVAPVAPGTRYDGGPEEGTRGAQFSDTPPNAVPGTRYDGGPEEGTRGAGR